MTCRVHIVPAALISALLSNQASSADTVVAARTIPVRSLISAEDLALSDKDTPGYLSDMSEAVGFEARVTLYEGRPISSSDIGPPALVERNDIVELLYGQGGLAISTEGRSLDRAGEGDRVRVMNLSSRITVTGTVTGPGQITVP